MSDVTEALVDVVLDEVPRQPPSRFEGVLEWLAEITKPPVGVRLVSDDGGTFTGFLIVEDNRPLVMLAVRTGGIPRRVDWHRPGQYTPSIDDELWADHDDHSK